MNARALGLVVMVAAVLLAPAVVSAQVGIGPRLAFVRGTEGSGDEESQRYIGGAMRLGSGKTVLELALDYRSKSTDEALRITDYPFQASLIVFPVRAGFAPYLVGGIGWYSQKVELRAGAGNVALEETTRKVGYHGGFGAEVRLHRRLGLYGDYRYTFIHFGDDDQDDTPSRPGLIPFADQLRLSHEGSMFTWGATFYF